MVASTANALGLRIKCRGSGHLRNFLRRGAAVVSKVKRILANLSGPDGASGTPLRLTSGATKRSEEIDYCGSLNPSAIS